MQLAGSVESSPVVQEILHSSLSFIMVLKFRDENTERNSASGLVGLLRAQGSRLLWKFETNLNVTSLLCWKLSSHLT